MPTISGYPIIIGKRMAEPPQAKKSLGQHWLNDQAALDDIAAAAELKAGESVLEIGPGLGTLTEVLLAQSANVTAVEVDKDLYDRLSQAKNFYNKDKQNLSLVNQDILKFDLTTLPPDYKVVANIPYYLTSKLIRTLSETTNPAKTVVLLVQKEVAQRVAAESGGMSVMSVSAQYYWQVELGREVPAKLFTPPPKVDSQVLILKRREQPLFPDIDEKQFFRIVKAGFAAKRKTLLNSLAGGLRTEKQQVSLILEKAKIDPSARPQTLSLDDWYGLYQACQQENADSPALI